ncbi:MAG: TolB family protein, partial [Acidimicrobiia bacterium]
MQRRRRLITAAAALLATASLPFLVTSPEAAAAPGPGYWMLDSQGRIYAFGAAEGFAKAAVPSTSRAVKIEATGDGNGAWVVDDRGIVYAYGTAVNRSPSAPTLQVGESIVTMARTASSNGYWLISSRGRTFNYGDAADVGDVTDFTPGNAPLNKPVIDAAKAVTGNGMYLVAEDGGVFTMGDARFYGSTGNLTLNSPVKSLVPDPDGVGYWLIAGDGGVFSFDAPFRGSMGSAKLNGPVVGMVSFGNGYLQVGSDGGIFNFSNLDFFGSLGGRIIPAPIVSVAAFASGGDTSNSTTTTTTPGSSTTTPGSTTTTTPGSTTTTTPGSTTTTAPPPAPGSAQTISSGAAAFGYSLSRATVSPDGCKVAFESDADLAGIDALTKPGGAVRDPNNNDSDTDNQRDLFLWDCNSAGVIRRLTNGIWFFDEAGTGSQYGPTDHQTANGVSVSPSMSADGRYIAFSSRADNPGIDGRTVVTGVNQHHAYGIFVLDTVTGSVERVDMTRSGEHWTAWDHGSRESPVQISGNGRFVVYQQASRVVGGAANYSNQIYMYDRTLARTTLVSALAGGGEMPGDAMSPTVSTDGLTITFSYKPLASSTTSDVYVWTANSDLLTHGGYWTNDPARTTLPDGPTGTLTRLTTGSAASMWPRVSADGSRIAFTSYANLDGATDTNARSDLYMPLYSDSFPSAADVFVCSKGGSWSSNCAGALTRITNGTGGSFMPWLSGNGRYLALQSDDSTPLDRTTGTTSATGEFVYDILTPGSPNLRLSQYTAGTVRQGPFLATTG